MDRVAAKTKHHSLGLRAGAPEPGLPGRPCILFAWKKTRW